MLFIVLLLLLIFPSPCLPPLEGQARAPYLFIQAAQSGRPVAIGCRGAPLCCTETNRYNFRVKIIGQDGACNAHHHHFGGFGFVVITLTFPKFLASPSGAPPLERVPPRCYAASAAIIGLKYSLSSSSLSYRSMYAHGHPRLLRLRGGSPK